MSTMTQATTTQQRSTDPKVAAHFHAAADLYHRWSPAGHLHFGHWEWPMAPWDRKAMLTGMVDRVADELELPRQATIADLGCGYGSAAIHLAKERPGLSVHGYTVMDEQVQEGMVQALMQGVDERVHLHTADYRNTGLPANSVDGATAVESMCYATGAAKQDFVEELHHILKPGARFAITDGFLIQSPKEGGILKRLLNDVAKGWAVDEFPERDAFILALQEQGFQDVRVHDLSFRVAPSAFHAPPLILHCLWERWRNNNPMNALERAHLNSCWKGLLLGMMRGTFRYLMITGTKGVQIST